MKDLKTCSLAGITKILSPTAPPDLTVASPAASVFTDFESEPPLMLEQDVGIDYAIDMMKREHVRLKLVIDHDEQFRGVITLADLLSVKVMRACERTGLVRADLTMAHIMTPRDALQAIDYRQLLHATIADVLATMRSHGEQHVLVLDNEHCAIRGIVSASDIARRLNLPIVIKERATSFAEIFDAVNA